MEFLNELRTQELINETKSRLAAKQDTLTFDDVPIENSNNPVKSGGVYAANETLTNEVNDIVNIYGAKNLLPYPYDTSTVTKNNISFTDNGDGTITISTLGDRSSNTFFDLNKGINFGDSNWSLIGSSEKEKTIGSFIASNGFDNFVPGLDFGYTVSNMQTWIVVSRSAELNNVTIKPMIRLASITDDTYEPYAKTNQELTADAKTLTNQVKDMNNVLGAKNILPFVYNQNVTNTQNCTASESNGVVTYTPSGIYSRMAYAYNGVLEIGVSYRVRFKAKFTKAGDPLSYALRSDYAWEDSGNYVFQIISSSTSDYVTIDEVFTATSEDLYLLFYVARGNSYSGNKLEIKELQINLASDTDSTYAPYAKTNQQLTEETTALLDNLEVNGAVNILENLVIARVSNGITATLNEDGTITLQSDGTTRTESTDFAINCLKGASYSSISGTINYEDGKTYYGSGCPKVSGVRLRFSATDSSVVDDSGDGCKFTYVSSSSNKGQVYIRISASADLTTPITVKPMITVAPYGDYVPYAKTNRQLTEDTASAITLANYINENGAINQFDITLSNTKSVNTGGTWDGNAFTYRGLTYTVNDDTDNIVITGTPTDNSFFFLLAKNIPAGRYTFGGLKDAANIVWDGGFWIYNGSVETAISTGAAGNKKDFTVDLSSYTFDRIKFGIKRKSNTLTNDTIKLFIRKADINIDVNAPYAKTNRELTEELTVESGDITRLVSFSAVTSYGVRKYGKVVELYFAGTLSEAVNTWTDFLTVPEGFRPSHYVQIASFNTYSSCKNLQLAPSGGIQSASNLSSGDFIRFSATYIID